MSEELTETFSREAGICEPLSNGATRTFYYQKYIEWLENRIESRPDPLQEVVEWLESKIVDIGERSLTNSKFELLTEFALLTLAKTKEIQGRE